MTPEIQSFVLVVVIPNLVLWIIAVIAMIYRHYRPSTPQENAVPPPPPPPQEEEEQSTTAFLEGEFQLPISLHEEQFQVVTEVSPKPDRLLTTLMSPIFTPFGTALPVKTRHLAVSETPRLSRKPMRPGMRSYDDAVSKPTRLCDLDEEEEERIEFLCQQLEEILDMGFLEDSVFEDVPLPVVEPTLALCNAGGGTV